jgi:hypothetical protein
MNLRPDLGQLGLCTGKKASCTPQEPTVDIDQSGGLPWRPVR